MKKIRNILEVELTRLADGQAGEIKEGMKVDL